MPKIENAIMSVVSLNILKSNAGAGDGAGLEATIGATIGAAVGATIGAAIGTIPGEELSGDDINWKYIILYLVIFFTIKQTVSFRRNYSIL